MDTSAMLTPASKRRITDFMDWFIRTEFVQARMNEATESGGYAQKGSLARDRFERCYAAAGHGGDGMTHYEVINDWRDAFSDFVRYGIKRGTYRNQFSRGYDRFEAAVNAYFDELEAWHERNGSLHEEIG